MKKVLFTATVDSHIKRFHLPYLKWFQEQGYEVHVATNGNEEITYCNTKHVIPFERNPIKINNIKAINQLKKIIEKEKFDIIHCHTPMGSVVTRIAAIKSRKKYSTRVIYTAHGFHFYKGAPLINWLIYYPIEKYLSRFTDVLITINKEDYELAKLKFKKCKRIELVNGVGLETKKFEIKLTEEEKTKKRRELLIDNDSKVLLYVAELNDNKNQKMLINAMQQLNKEVSNIVLLLAGNGKMYIEYEKYIKKHSLDKNVKLLGKRNDINELLSITDIYVASSLREGLPLNILEAMYVGLPIIAKNNRGHRELIKNGVNGYIVEDEKDLVEKIMYLLNNQRVLPKMIQEGRKISEKYLISNIKKEMEKIYNE